MSHSFNIKISSDKLLNFELCNWNDYGYRYMWDLSINNESLGTYILIPFNKKGILLSSEEIGNLDFTNKDDELPFIFVSKATDAEVYSSLIKKLKFDTAKNFLQKINDIIFSFNIGLADTKINEVKSPNNKNFIISNNDIKIQHSDVKFTQEEKLFYDFNGKDVISSCLFRGLFDLKPKVEDLLNQYSITNKDIDVLFLYKEYLLHVKNFQKSTIINLLTIILSPEEFSNPSDIADTDNEEVILNDPYFQKLNYECLLFEIIKNRFISDINISKRFSLYCITNNFTEGKRLVYSQNHLTEKQQEILDKIPEKCSEIRSLLSLKDEKELPLLCSYTTFQAAKSIYENKTLYLSEIHQMNDPLENRVFESFLSQCFNSSLYYNINTYVASLTDKIDYLPMWNTYGDHGKGVCYIFNTEILDKIKEEIYRVCYIKRIPNNTLDVFKEFISVLRMLNNKNEATNDEGCRVDSCKEVVRRLKNTIIIKSISGYSQNTEELDFENNLEQVRRLMVKYIEQAHTDSINFNKKSIDQSLWSKLKQIKNFLIKISSDNENDNNKSIYMNISNILNSIRNILNDNEENSDEQFDVGKQLALAEIIEQLGSVLKFEDYSYEHEYRIIKKTDAVSKVKRDTEDFEDKICNGNIVKFKLDFTKNNNNIFSSVIFGPKSQYDMIYPRFKLVWKNPNVLLQKSEIHYR